MNKIIFGQLGRLKEDKIHEMRSNGTYHPMDYYNNSPYIKRILNTLNSNMFCEKDYVLLFKPIFEELLNRDYYFLLADFTTMPDRANRASTLGSTISWLNMSVSSQTRSLDRTEPRKTNTSAMTE